MVWSLDDDRLGFEALVVFGGAGEEEGVGVGGVAYGDGGDDVGAAEPVGFGEVGVGPLRGVVGVGVVEADDVEALVAGLALGGDELFGSDVVAVVRGIGARVAGAEKRGDADGGGLGFAEENAAAFVGVGGFAVGAEVVVEGLGEDEGHELVGSDRSCLI